VKITYNYCCTQKETGQLSTPLTHRKTILKRQLVQQKRTKCSLITIATKFRHQKTGYKREIGKIALQDNFPFLKVDEMTAAKYALYQTISPLRSINCRVFPYFYKV